jgi:hypothetical protein
MNKPAAGTDAHYAPASSSAHRQALHNVSEVRHFFRTAQLAGQRRLAQMDHGARLGDRACLRDLDEVPQSPQLNACRV